MESSQVNETLNTEEHEEPVLLRRDSHTLRENRRQSRERTPTALVSSAFKFLNEDLHSSVELFGNDSLNISDFSTKTNSADGNQINSNSDENCFPESVFPREYKSKDSGFASLERQLDRETIQTAFSEFKSDSDEAQASDKSCPSDIISHSISNTSLDKENGSIGIKQTPEGDRNAATVTNISEESEKVDTQPSDFISEPQLECDKDPIESNMKDITNRVALAMTVLINAKVSDDEFDDVEDESRTGSVVENNNTADEQETFEVLGHSTCEQLSICSGKGISNDSNIRQNTKPEHLVSESASDDFVKEQSLEPKIEIENQSDIHAAEPCWKDNESAVRENSLEIPILTKKSCEDSVETEQCQVSVTSGVESNSFKAAVGESQNLRSQESDSKVIKIERTNQGNAVDDDSSDEDTGIYAESFRRSNWIRVSKEGKLHLHIPTPLPSSSSTSSPVPSSTDNVDAKDKNEPDHFDAKDKNESDHVDAKDNNESNNVDQLLTSAALDADDVFDQTDPLPQNWTHQRSDSLASTASESEFKHKYVSRRKCLIQRADSQQEYHRLSARIYEQDKEVILERNSECQDLGLHLLDSHPAFITSVDPGSPAEKAGIVEGQILVSVNDVSVLTTSHADIIDMIQKCKGSISLGVANSDFQPVRDLQIPVIAGYLYKLGHSSLMRMWKKRYFILRHDNCLYYYKNEQELDPLGALPLNGYTISRHTETNKDFCFKAEKYGARSYFFMTDSRDQMTEWVGAMTQAAVRSKKRKESFLSVSSHNVSLPALDIRRPECSGFLYKFVNRSWNRRYCVLKDACIYYYKDVNSLSALGVAHLHGYTIDVAGHPKKKNSFSLHPPESKMRIFHFSVDNDTDKKRWVESLIHSIQRWVKVDN